MDKIDAGLRAEAVLADIAGSGEIWRPSFTPEYMAAKDKVRELMAQTGLRTYEDAVGNLYGVLKGESECTVLTGSHLDTVRNGGKYDGACGIVLPVLALEELVAEGFKPKKTVSVIAMFEEEGSRFPSSYLSSRFITGKITDAELEERDKNWISIREAMQTCGYDPADYKSAKLDHISAFFELHVEQGPRLYNCGADIGVVENIVGLYSYELTLTGKQNHAGTTPMNMRLDPVLEACRIIDGVDSFVRAETPSAVVTAGGIRSVPGLSNVIAEEAFFTLDFRAGSQAALGAIDGYIRHRLKDSEAKGFAVKLTVKCAEPPCRMDSGIAAAVQNAADEAGLKSLHMDSGAGHDSQIIATSFPTGMVFIPSVDGVSHSPREYTRPEDLKNGIKTVKQLILRLAGEAK